MYFRDFDKNGTEDIYLSVNYKGRDVPVRGRECSSQQMPFIAEKYATYAQFANAGITDILGMQNIDSSLVLEAKEFGHTLFINENNTFKETEYLPQLSQVSPIRNSVFVDLNKDGKKDMLSVGNFKDTEVETAAYDAGTGYCAINIDGSFQALPPYKSGFLIKGETRDIQLLKLANGKTVALVSKYGEKMEVLLLP